MVFFLIALFQYILPSDMATRTVQSDIWSFLGDSSITMSCNSINRHRRFWGSFSVSLLLYRENLLLLSVTLEKTCCFCLSSRARTCCFSLLLYRQNLLLLSAILDTELAASLCYSRYRTCCFSLLLTKRTCCFSLSSRARTCCFSLLLYRQNLLLLSEL